MICISDDFMYEKWRLCDAMITLGMLTIEWQYIIYTILMMALGGWLIVPKFLSDRKQNRVCTEKVVAVCTHIDRRFKTGTGACYVYCPYYSFQYQGKHCYVHNDSYSNISAPGLGAAVYLRINPENPEQFCRESSGSAQFTYVIGVLVLLFGFMGLRSLLQKWKCSCFVTDKARALLLSVDFAARILHGTLDSEGDV